MGAATEVPMEIVTESPAAKGGSPTTYGGHADSVSSIRLAGVLVDVMHVDRVLFESHFFDDLGADSLVLAHFCARVRKRAGPPSVSINDVYRHHTPRSLAKPLTPAAPDPADASLSTVEMPVARGAAVFSRNMPVCTDMLTIGAGEDAFFNGCRERRTDVRFVTTFFGDTSYIVNYLRWIGYELTPVVRTRCNFGMEVKSENPFMTAVGSGTVTDGLSIVNTDYSSTSCRVSPAAVGSNDFIRNRVVYLARSRTGADYLLATNVAIPVDGEIRVNMGIPGSGSLEIPRSVQRDSRVAHLKRGQQRRAVATRNRYDMAGMGLFLLARLFLVYVIFLVLLTTAALYDSLGATVLAGAGVLALLFGIFYLVLMERAVSHFRRLRPQYCSIYDPYFWWHERFWKVPVNAKPLDGTPFRKMVWRLLGVRVFDDGCAVIAETLTTVADGCTFNAGSRLQGHSQEDGAGKADHITIGAGCALGVGSLDNYGVTMGEGAVLAPDSFLMKGDDVPPYARWGGNRAREIDGNRAAVQGGGK